METGVVEYRRIGVRVEFEPRGAAGRFNTTED